MNNFIVGFGLWLEKYYYGYSFYFPVLLGKRGYIFYFIYNRPFLRAGSLFPRRVIFRFRPLNKGGWPHMNLSIYCTLFCLSRGYHFLIAPGDPWLGVSDDD